MMIPPAACARGRRRMVGWVATRDERASTFRNRSPQEDYLHHRVLIGVLTRQPHHANRETHRTRSLARPNIRAQSPCSKQDAERTATVA